MDKFAVLIPVYNEEYAVLKIAEALEALDVRYLFVDDGSTDRTATHLWLKDLSALCYFPNRGKGFAIQLGAKYLIKEGYEWILIMDSDGQHSCDDIEKFDTALLFNENDYKIFMGNRLWSKHNQMPRLRYHINRFMSWILSKIAGQKITDSQCGFRLVHKSIFELDIKSDKFDYESEMLIKASRAGHKIKDVPIKCIYYRDRKSKIRPIADACRFIKLIAKLLKED